MGGVGGLVGQKVDSGSTIVGLVGLFMLFIGCTLRTTNESHKQPHEFDNGAAAGHLPPHQATQPFHQAPPPHLMAEITPGMVLLAHCLLPGPPTPPTEPTRPSTAMEEMGEFSPIVSADMGAAATLRRRHSIQLWWAVELAVIPQQWR